MMTMMLNLVSGGTAMATAEKTATASMQCAGCGTSFPRTARFCPRCGRPVERSAEGGNDHLPPPLKEEWPANKSRMPLAGMLFLAGIILAPLLIVGGLYFGSALLIWAGVVAGVCVAVTLVLGMIS